MRLFKILLGIVFALGAISSLILGLNRDWAGMDLSLRGLSASGAMAGSVAVWMLFSVWSLQSALRPRDNSQSSAADGDDPHNRPTRAGLWWPARDITRRNIVKGAAGILGLGFAAKWMFDTLRARPAFSGKPFATGAEGMPPCDTFLDVNEFKKSLTVEELCKTSEQYFAVLEDWQYQLAKPLSDVEEAPHLLHNFAHVLEGLQLVPGMSVVDFGAGSCWASRWLTQMGMEVIALDVSPTALQIGRELYARLPIIGDRPLPRFLAFDGHRIDLADASVDRILCLDTFHHVLNPEEVLREMSRILRPGGIAGFSEPGPHHSQSAASQFEMRNFRVLEDDIHVGEIWLAAQQAGFARMTLAVTTPEAFRLSLVEFEDYLSGGQTNQRFAAATRRQMQERRLFFLQKEGEPPRPDSRGRAGLGAALKVNLASSHVTSGRVIIAHVIVTNTGTAVWLPSSFELGGVLLGCHLLDSSGKMLTQDFFRHPLAAGSGRPLAPGETLEFDVRIPPPPRGAYLLEFDMLSTSVVWFSMNGSPTVRLAIQVE